MPGPAQEVQTISVSGILVTATTPPQLESWVGRVIPVPSLDESHFLEPSLGPTGAWRLVGAGQSWGVCVGGECKVKTRRIGKSPGKENKYGVSELI